MIRQTRPCEMGFVACRISNYVHVTAGPLSLNFSSLQVCFTLNITHHLPSSLFFGLIHRVLMNRLFILDSRNSGVLYVVSLLFIFYRRGRIRGRGFDCTALRES
ncbi:hypothetical protein DL95DRAFT_385836 [Leptodontidium sp. 2 PMI_412]|nr:hypothetical protein DL95DRAFT_385836 [Leptodontidium sp. 2 PMI_412]